MQHSSNDQHLGKFVFLLLCAPLIIVIYICVSVVILSPKKLIVTVRFALYGAKIIILLRTLLPCNMICCACDCVLLQVGMRGEGR